MLEGGFLLCLEVESGLKIGSRSENGFISNTRCRIRSRSENACTAKFRRRTLLFEVILRTAYLKMHCGIQSRSDCGFMYQKTGS